MSQLKLRVLALTTSPSVLEADAIYHAVYELLPKQWREDDMSGSWHECSNVSTRGPSASSVSTSQTRNVSLNVR